MAKHQHEKRMNHFSHEHPLSLIEIEDEEVINESNWYDRSFLRCYGCTEKIRSGVPYYRCEEECPLFCLHYACAHLPPTIEGSAHFVDSCQGVVQLRNRPNKDNEYCHVCTEEWYRFAYVCSDCGIGTDIKCAVLKGPNEAKHSFHQHPVQLFYFQGKVDDLPVCSVCTLTITHLVGSMYFYYKCNYCNFNVHPECTNLPFVFQSPYHHHNLMLKINYVGSKICKICQQEIDRSSQWAYMCSSGCDDGDFYIHAGYDACLTSTIRLGDLQHFDHDHPLALVEEEKDPPALDGTRTRGDSPISLDCRCCKQNISSMPYYTCLHCKKYHLHELCRQLPMELKHQLHPKCTLKLMTGLHKICDICEKKCKGFVYNCSTCDFDLDTECALKTQKLKSIFHHHSLLLLLTKGPFNCHACDRDDECMSYHCTSCKFWVHEKCGLLPEVKDKSSHEHQHELYLVRSIPEKYSRMIVYCRICTKVMKHQRWAYHCNQCRYLIHVHDCSTLHRERVGVSIDASDVVHLPLDGEPIVEEKLTHGKMTKHYRHPMILFADQLEYNANDITTSFLNLIRGSTKWPTFRVNRKDYNGITFSFHNNTLTMQVTGIELPRYIKHEDHPHVLDSIFLNSSTWCHACEQSFFGQGFKCTTCAFTIDTYCAVLPRMIKHRYDKHGFTLTYFAIEGIEEYVCEICEEDVTPRYFYHCVSCDQSIHARCIWHAYVQFQPYFSYDLGRRSVMLVPPSENLSQCIICKQKETYGHGFAFQDKQDDNFLVHLTCISEDDVET